MIRARLIRELIRSIVCVTAERNFIVGLIPDWQVLCALLGSTYFTLPEMFDGSRLIDELEIQIIPKTATDIEIRFLG